jgi:hypothetical protein
MLTRLGLLTLFMKKASDYSEAFFIIRSFLKLMELFFAFLCPFPQI